jgi:predicted transposase YbfD/YdcC
MRSVVSVEIAAQIVQKKGDYVIAVKKNQKRLRAAIHACFKNDSAPTVAKLGPYEYFEKKEKSRGRIEERFYTLVKVPKNFPSELRELWPSVAAIGRAVRRTIKPDGSFTKEMRYYITSRYQSGSDFATTVRQHWHIENRLHWVLDVILREDDCRVRNRRMANNLAWLRRFALSLARLHPKKDSLKGKLQAAAWSDDFLLQLLTTKGP